MRDMPLEVNRQNRLLPTNDSFDKIFTDFAAAFEKHKATINKNKANENKNSHNNLPEIRKAK